MSKPHELTAFGQRKFHLGPIAGIFAWLISLIVIPVSVICLLLVVGVLFTCGAVRGCSSVTPVYVGEVVPAPSASSEVPQEKNNGFQTWACKIIQKDLKSPDPMLKQTAKDNWKSYRCDELEGKN